MDAPVNVDCAGIDYARRGWSVIPLEPYGDQPLWDWRDFQGRIADSEEIGWLPGCGPGDVAVAPLPPWLLALLETRG